MTRGLKLASSSTPANDRSSYLVFSLVSADRGDAQLRPVGGWLRREVRPVIVGCCRRSDLVPSTGIAHERRADWRRSLPFAAGWTEVESCFGLSQLERAVANSRLEARLPYGLQRRARVATSSGSGM